MKKEDALKVMRREIGPDGENALGTIFGVPLEDLMADPEDAVVVAKWLFIKMGRIK